MRGKIGTIDIRDRNTFIWSISHCLVRTNSEFNWDNKYPRKFPLMPIESQWVEEKQLTSRKKITLVASHLRKDGRKCMQLTKTTTMNYNY
jgi:hypothetical protein